MSQNFLNYLMHTTQKHSDIYDFTFITRASIQEGAKVIEIDCSNTSYVVNNKLLDKIQEELLDDYIQSGFPRNDISIGLSYTKKTIVFQFKQFFQFKQIF